MKNYFQDHGNRKFCHRRSTVFDGVKNENKLISDLSVFMFKKNLTFKRENIFVYTTIGNNRSGIHNYTCVFLTFWFKKCENYLSNMIV